jgi:hypothetical protein
MASQRFPAPWSVVEIPGGCRVEDATGIALGYFYSWNDPATAHQADVLSRDEARRMAENFARLPELLTGLSTPHPTASLDARVPELDVDDADAGRQGAGDAAQAHVVDRGAERLPRRPERHR